jgi:hypothetical protein
MRTRGVCLVTSARQRTFLIEHYRPGVGVAEIRRSVTRIREAVRQMAGEDKLIRYRGSTIVPDDEYYLSTIEATSDALVREAYARAGVVFERISVAISVSPAGRDDDGDPDDRAVPSGMTGLGTD